MIWLWIILAYIAMEICINVIFHFITQWLKNSQDSKVQRKREVMKGVLERLVLVLGMFVGYPQVIVAFGALKIGTRFQKNSKVSNDYFLIGNFISLLGAILFIILIKKFLFL